MLAERRDRTEKLMRELQEVSEFARELAAWELKRRIRCFYDALNVETRFRKEKVARVQIPEEKFIGWQLDKRLKAGLFENNPDGDLEIMITKEGYFHVMNGKTFFRITILTSNRPFVQIPLSNDQSRVQQEAYQYSQELKHTPSLVRKDFENATALISNLVTPEMRPKLAFAL